MLALDIGNGSIKYARFDERDRRTDGGRLALDADLSALAPKGRSAAVSVNPPVLERAREALPGLLVVGEDLPLPLPVLYDPPEACGADRVMAAYGALSRRPGAEAVLVLEAGTCLTATLAVRDKGILGGAILPGPALMARSLNEHTAALPAVEPAPPETALGRTTEASIRSGIWAAFVGSARELIRRIGDELDGPLEVVASGSGGGALAAALPEVHALHPYATLWGVYLSAR
ncbi:MAG: type III pantothenate kinase [Planctomycetota bacterium]